MLSPLVVEYADSAPITRARDVAMPFTLDITFGGLCLFVQRKTGPRQGLFVLMPLEQGHHGHSDEHVPTIIDPRGVKYRMCLPQLVDLVSVSGGHGSPTDLPQGLADVSAYAGGVKVHPRWLDSDPSEWGECLAARIEMPLGSTFTTVGDRAKMAVTYGNPRRTEKLSVVGRVTVQGIQIRADSVQIDPVTIRPGTSADRVHISLLNVTRKDLSNAPLDKHEMCEVMPHFRAYYRLLNEYCEVPVDAPDLVVDEFVPGRTPPSEVAPTEVEGVDPYRCTVGIGAPP